MRMATAAAALFLVLASCGGGEESAVKEDGEPWHFVDTLLPIDSIGVELGDSCYMFGHLSAVVPISEGRVAVLDQISGRASIFSEEGVLLRQFARHGEGPGEVLRASDMTILPGGDFLIHDSMGRKLVRYAATGEYVESCRTSDFIRFISFSGFTDSSFVGYCFDVMQTDEGFSSGYSLAEYSTSTGEVLLSHFRDTRPISGTEPDFSGAYKAVCVDPERGLTYVSDMVTDEYSIRIYDGTGLLLNTIRKDDEAVPIDMETDVGYHMPVFAVNIQYQDDEDAGGMVGYSRPRMRPFVASMSVDGDGNLWARRGTENRHVWDVFSPEWHHIGEVLIVGVPEDETMVLHLNRHGIAASVFYPEDYPRVYLLERPEWVGFE